jgi:hypothetical protein
MAGYLINREIPGVWTPFCISKKNTIFTTLRMLLKNKNDPVEFDLHRFANRSI